MTGVLVGLLALLWAGVLLPVLLSARQHTSVLGSVGTFSRSMRALSSNHIQPSMGGRWVLTPRAVDDEEERKATMLRRRRIFVSLLGSFGGFLFLGLLPGLHSLLWIALVLGIGLGGYVAYLVEEKKKAPVHRRLAVPLKVKEPRLDEVPTVLKLAYTPPRSINANGVRPIHRIVDDSLEEDDGLSELAWAGRF